MDTVARYQDELFTSIYYKISNSPHIGVWTDYGRIMTPVIKGEWKGTLVDMIKKGNLIYICADMADNFIIQEYYNHDSKAWYFLP